MILKLKIFKLNRIILLSFLVSLSLQAQKDTLKLLHISDTHTVFELEDSNPIFFNLRKHLLGSADSLKEFLKTVSLQNNTDGVVITGDLIDYYQVTAKNNLEIVANQITRFNSISKTSPVPIYLTLGNHDIANYIISEIDSTKIELDNYSDKARAEWIRKVPSFKNGTYYKKEFSVDGTKYNLFFLDDGYRLNDRKRILDKTQLDWLSAQLNKIGNEPVVLFFHIYLPVGDINGDGIYFRKNIPTNWPGKNDCKDGLLKILNEHNNIKAMFVGHQHRNVWEEINFPSGNKVYQIQTAALFNSTNNWRSISFTKNSIIISQPGINKKEILIKINSPKEFIPKKINGLKVNVIPAGNDFYKEPHKTISKKQLPDKIKKIVKLVSPPEAVIAGWEIKDNNYAVRTISGNDRYYFTISESGKIRELDFKNYYKYMKIYPSKSIIKGSMKKISKALIPTKTKNIISQLSNSNEPSEYYSINTPYGKRYLIVNDGMVYQITLNGQIQTIGAVKDGALNENDSSNLEKIKSHQEVIAECDSLLKRYKNKLDFKKSIIKVKNSVENNSQFRFVIMGDSRSNKEVWNSIIEHINKIKPRPAFIINSGDLVKHGFTKEYADYFIPGVLKTDIPYFIAIGNHDDGVRDSAIEFRYLFGKNSLNYYFDLGKYRFIMFDNSTKINGHGAALPWLEKILSETPKNLSTIVIAHKPPSTVKKWSWHAWDKSNSKKFVALMTKSKVKYVFLGHIHGYSTENINGILYTVSGGGGAELRGARFGEEGNSYHYIICDTMPDGSVKQKVVEFYKK